MANYYVDGVAGTNTNSGTNSSVPVKGLTYGLSLFATGGNDTLYVKASTTYNERMITSKAGAASGQGHRVIGYSTTVTDNGVATIDGGGTLTHGVSAIHAYYTWKNLQAQNFTGSGFYMPGPDYNTMANCHAISNGVYGIYVDNYITVLYCTARSNTQDGLRIGAQGIVRGGEYSNNGAYGVYFFNDSDMRSVSRVLAHDNTGDQFYNWCGGTIDHCTIDGGGSTAGIRANASIFTRGYALSNNIIIDCVTAVIGPTTQRSMYTADSNILYNNTATYLNFTKAYDTDLYSNPSLDANYVPGSGSPAQLAGSDGTDIGAFQSTISGTGTGSSRIVLTS
jgi:hypothetical protein